MKPNLTLIAALALALAVPLSASAETSTARKAQKIHPVSLKSRPATKAAAPKEMPVKMRLPQHEPAPAETVYDYSSCGCS